MAGTVGRQPGESGNENNERRFGTAVDTRLPNETTAYNAGQASAVSTNVDQFPMGPAMP
jgi:hypothetical protein